MSQSGFNTLRFPGSEIWEGCNEKLIKDHTFSYEENIDSN